MSDQEFSERWRRAGEMVESQQRAAQAERERHLEPQQRAAQTDREHHLEQFGSVTKQWQRLDESAVDLPFHEYCWG